MNKEQISENESITLDSKKIDIAKEILATSPDLPIEIHGNRLGFKQYIVGQLQLGDLVIEILPRNDAFTLEKYFEMLVHPA